MMKILDTNWLGSKNKKQKLVRDNTTQRLKNMAVVRPDV